MILEPVFKYLSNTLISDNTGLEYNPNSKKALCIAWLKDHKVNENKSFGFLFSDVEIISQKVKNKMNANLLGCTDMGMLHFLYYLNLEDERKRYVFHSEENFIVINAKSVELIEGLDFM
ncbi:hypothetical protein [Tenacibaculum jejuense]|uniref:Uncharacterized protein n=1 Tax=Tenacibaculum jejuense TaxID=584609 RepID=A0A238U9W8_9FLAO|nr:hypothetical protein [Tenacibaculum jejuense]SNR15997.1 protein of unknown function [Tenacibaculum jejuense]